MPFYPINEDLLVGGYIRLEDHSETQILAVTDFAYICAEKDLGLKIAGWRNQGFADWVVRACSKENIPDSQRVCLIYKTEVRGGNSIKKSPLLNIGLS